ncbi:MAG: starch-binding protein [Candidatus Amulumruptor caecigallinarius]|nr:starch-binding protein [Candidatus Amulumruptor caecigallinarius]MCM1395876.1 starch-binding protein [Candidatus Amulumruptor caecigallinarius]MCM1452911.1 starch-binding protein [bacterium]
MKKLYFLMITMLCAIAAQAWTVSFTNPNGWQNVYAYCYNGAGEVLGSWPGSEMTKSGDVWTITCDKGEPQKIIFNDKTGSHNPKQTGNLDFVAGATYDMNGVVGAVTEDYSVYFDNSVSNWDKVYAYTYMPEMFGGFPGKELSKNADGLYVATVSLTSAPECGGLIFSNGDSDQTSDLEWITGETYNKNGIAGQEPWPMEEWFVSIGGSFVEGQYEWNWGDGHNPIDGVANLGEYTIGTNEFELKVYNGIKDTYYGTTTPIVAGADKWNQLSEGGGHMTIEGATEGAEYNVKFDCNTNELCLTPTGASINAVAAEAAVAPAAYYNLQGIRVANPEAGVFIMVQGGKAVKVVK